MGIDTLSEPYRYPLETVTKSSNTEAIAEVVRKKIMARIRNVKPDLFKHYDLFNTEVEVGLPLRLAFIGLFTVCDREGRFRWNPRRLKIDVFPYDDLDFSQVLDALARAEFIQNYTVDGEEYGCIPSFVRHQTINNKESKSKYPAFDDNNHVSITD